jgi:hypothetical protein
MYKVVRVNCIPLHKAALTMAKVIKPKKKTPKTKSSKAVVKKTPKKTAVKKPAKNTTKKSTPVTTNKSFVKITFTGRKEEAIAEMRSSIHETDILASMSNIEEDYRNVFIDIMKKHRPTYEDANRWKYAISTLEKRSSNNLKMLNKIAPDFMAEELTQTDSGAGSVLDPAATRDEAFAKLSKVLKPRSKVSNIKDAK